MRSKSVALWAAAAALVCPSVAFAQSPAAAAPAAGSLIPSEQFTLPNGLKVIFHIDRSDPVVAVLLNAHVGSARETPGRTGFAHMFEHLFFLDSENVGKGGLDKLSARVGGSGANGSTTYDRTDYLQTVPSDALEKMLWAESDKLGFFINTVTEPVLAKEKQVVKNEKRQGVDNQPYGHLETVIVENLYPKDHPYSWTVIGSLADLDAATLDDVKQFYRRWYVPNNVTLVVAGDFNPAQAKAWVTKYFGEIPAGAPVPAMTPRPANLPATKKVFHEDNFADLPQLSMVWSTVPRLHPDYRPLDILITLLAGSRDAPLYAEVVDKQKLAPDVAMEDQFEKLDGAILLQVTAFDETPLDKVRAAIDAGFANFEKTGVDPAALARAKTAAEIELYENMDSVLNKARLLAAYDLHAGDAGAIDGDLRAVQAVTADDVMRVYRKYIKGRPHLAASFVPKGKAALALSGSAKAKIVEEAIVQGAEAEVDASAAATFARTPSSFDRTIEPPYGASPRVVVPDVWRAALPNGLDVTGIVDREVPLANFELSVDGGRLQDSLALPGVAAMTARMLTRGTARRTPAELEKALKDLGADIAIVAEDERFLLRGSTLARNFAPTMKLVEEILLEPRWDAEELELARKAALNQLRDEGSQPDAIAARAFAAVTYGRDHILSRPAVGTERSIGAMAMDDLKRFHATRLTPGIARMRVVGDIDRTTVASALTGLGQRWTGRAVPAPAWPKPAAPTSAKAFFYDVPDAKQSVLVFGNPSLERAAPDRYPAVVMNYRLGGGGFASRLTQELREGKGYTYGVNSQFDSGRTVGNFRLVSPVRANVTLEAAQLGRKIMADYGKTFTASDLEVTKAFLTKARARSFESATAKLGFLANIGDYRLPADYPRQEQAVVDAMDVSRIAELARKYVRTDAMNYVVVGDAKTQQARLKALGLGEPVRINELVDDLAR